jgi:hypothetical protein
LGRGIEQKLWLGLAEVTSINNVDIIRGSMLQDTNHRFTIPVYILLVGQESAYPSLHPIETVE